MSSAARTCVRRGTVWEDTKNYLENVKLITLLWSFVPSYHFFFCCCCWVWPIWCLCLSPLAAPLPQLPSFSPPLSLVFSVFTRLGQWGGTRGMWACLSLLLTLCLLHKGEAESDGGGPRCQLPPAWSIGEEEPMKGAMGRVTVVALFQASWLFCLVQATRYRCPDICQPAFTLTSCPAL